LNNYDRKLLEKLDELKEVDTTGMDDREIGRHLGDQGEIEKQIADQNTIVTALVKHKDGVPQFDHEKGGIYTMYSESDFTKKASGRQDGNCSEQLIRGELTIDKFKKGFKNQNGISFDRFHKRRDKKLERTGSPLDKVKTEKLIQESILIKEGRYTSLLQETMKYHEEIVENTEQELESSDELSSTQLAEFLSIVGKDDHIKKYETETEDWLKERRKQFLLAAIGLTGEVDVSNMDIDEIIEKTRDLEEAFKILKQMEQKQTGNKKQNRKGSSR
jgi:hypothetical protein